MTVGDEGVSPSAGSARYRIVVEDVATDDFNILTLGNFSIQSLAVPEPPAIIFLGIGAAGLTIAAGFARYRARHP